MKGKKIVKGFLFLIVIVLGTIGVKPLTAWAAGSAPQDFTIKGFYVGPDYSNGTDGKRLSADGKIEVAWVQRGDADSYDISVTDSRGSKVYSVTHTGGGNLITIPAGTLSRGSQYTVEVVAKNAYGTSSAKGTLYTEVSGVPSLVSVRVNPRSFDWGENETMSVTGSVSANGGTLERVYCKYIICESSYSQVDPEEYGFLFDVSPNSGSYSFSQDFVIGGGAPFRAAEYDIYIYAKCTGGEEIRLYSTDISIEEPEIPTPPGAFSFTSLTEGKELNAEIDHGIAWSTAENRDGYIVKITDNKTGNVVLTADTERSRSYKILAGTLKPGGSYTFEVTAYNEGGNTTISVRFVTTAAETKTYPKKTGDDLADKYFFDSVFNMAGKVSAEGGVLESVRAGYRDSYGNDYSLGTKTVDGKANITLSNYFGGYTVGNDIFPKVGYYTVYVYAKNVGSEEVPVYERTIYASKTPLEFEITYPVKNYVDGFVEGQDLTVTWNSSKYADYYILKMIRHYGNVEVFSEMIEGETSCTIPGDVISEEGGYDIVVTAYENLNGNYYEAWRVLSFEEDETLGSFSLIYPSSEERIDLDEEEITVSWTEAENVQYYALSVTRKGSTVFSMEVGHDTSWTIDISDYYREDKYKLEVTAVGYNGQTKTRSSTMYTYSSSYDKEQNTPTTPVKPTVGAFSIVSPAEGVVVSADADLILMWTEAENANYYYFSVADITTGRHEYLIESIQTTSTSATARRGTLEAGHKYVVYVTACYDDNTVYRQSTKFTAKAAPTPIPVKKPGEFYITAPTTGTEIKKGDSVKVTWTESTDSDYYTISLRDLTTDTLLLNGKKVTSGQSYTISASTFTAGHEYRIAVMSYNDNDKRSGGEVKIAVKAEPTPVPVKKPGEFYITAPTTGTEIKKGDSVKVTWTESTDSDYYTISLRDLTTDTLLLNGKKVTSGQSYTISASTFTAGHEYRIAVMSYNDNDKRSGGEVKITVDEEKPVEVKVGSFSIVAPVDGVTVSADADLILSWTSAENATYYKYTLEELTGGTSKEVVKEAETPEESAKVPRGTLKGGCNYILRVTAYYDTKTYVERSVEFSAKNAPTAAPTPVTPEPKPELPTDDMAKIQFKNEYNEKMNGNKGTLSWTSSLTSKQQKEVGYTVVQMYRKASDGTSKIVVNKQFSGCVSSYDFELKGGVYGIEVSYFDKSYKKIANGQSRISTPITISDFTIDNTVEGQVSHLRGTINARAEIVKIQCEIGTELSYEYNLGMSTNEYKLYRSAVDNAIDISSLSAGEKQAVITVIDTNGEACKATAKFVISEIMKEPENELPEQKPEEEAPEYEDEQKDNHELSVEEEIQKNIEAFDMDQFLANGKVAYAREYTVGGEVYRLYTYDEDYTFFIDSQNKVIDDKELLLKLHYTREQADRYESYSTTEKGFFGINVEVEQNLLFGELEYLADELDTLFWDVVQVHLTREYVRFVGGNALHAWKMNPKGMVIATARLLASEATNWETYMYGVELSVLYDMFSSSKKLHTYAKDGLLNNYDTTFDLFRTREMSIIALHNGFVSGICESLGISEIDNLFDKLVYWAKNTWEGFSIGMGMDKVSKEAVNAVIEGVHTASELAQHIPETEEGELYSALLYVSKNISLTRNTSDWLRAKGLANLAGMTTKILKRADWLIPYVNAYTIYDEHVVIPEEQLEIFWQQYRFLDEIMAEGGPSLQSSKVKVAKGESVKISFSGLASDAEVVYIIPKDSGLSVSADDVVTLTKEFSGIRTITIDILQNGKEYRRYFSVEMTK